MQIRGALATLTRCGLGPQFACTVIAILLHFLYLCTFSWALLEALHLYRALTEVRDVNAGPMRFYYMLGWGVPAFITGILPCPAGHSFLFPSIPLTLSSPTIVTPCLEQNPSPP